MMCKTLWLETDDEEIANDDDEYKNNYNNFDDFITPNHDIGRKNN